MTPYQPPEEPLGSSPTPSGLKIHINQFTILVHCPPEIVLLAIDLHKDFIDEKGIAIPSVLSFQSAGINGSELDAEPAQSVASALGTRDGWLRWIQ